MKTDHIYVKKVAAGNREAAGAAIEALLASLPAAAGLSAHSRVLLKPNLLSKNTPEKAVTTHPDVVYGVIRALQRRGVTNIMLADSPGGIYTPAAMQDIYKASGLAAVCEETGVQLYTACESAPKQGPGLLVNSFHMIQPVLERDFIINLPKMKTHVLTGMSGAVKNLFGCIPGLQKAEFHARFPQRERFCSMLVDVCETVQADIHIVDGLLAMEGDGPGGGRPREAGLLLAGENPYTMDLALARYMGLDTAALPIIQAARQRGLAPAALDESLLVGEEQAKEPIKGFVPPRSYAGLFTYFEGLPQMARPLFAPFAAQWLAPRPKIIPMACIGCGKCATICPQGVIHMNNKKAKIDPKGCIRCFCCHEVCPAKAIAIKRSRFFKQ